MFDVEKILGNKKNKNKTKFTDMTLSSTFGKNPFSDMVGNITDKPLRNMGAPTRMQNKWKHMNPVQRNNARHRYKDSDGDRIPNRFDCQPFNSMRQDSDWDPYGVEEENMKIRDIYAKEYYDISRDTQREGEEEALRIAANNGECAMCGAKVGVSNLKALNTANGTVKLCSNCYNEAMLSFR